MNTKKTKSDHVLVALQKGDIEPSPEVLYNIFYTLFRGYVEDLEDLLMVLEQVELDMKLHTVLDASVRSENVREMLEIIRVKLHCRRKELEELK